MENKFTTNGNAPEDAKVFNHESLAIAWPRIIARAWLYQKEFSANAELIEQGKYQEIIDANADDNWYFALMSQQPDNVKKAFISEGLVTLGSKSSTTGDNNWEQWITSDLYVVKFSNDIEINIPAVEAGGDYDPANANNGWTDVKGIDHTVVFTLPEAPEKDEEFALALADYSCAGKTYVFTG